MNYRIINDVRLFTSSGEGFNAQMKYKVMVGNFNAVCQEWGLFIAFVVGIGLIGPDVRSGNSASINR